MVSVRYCSGYGRGCRSGSSGPVDVVKIVDYAKLLHLEGSKSEFEEKYFSFTVKNDILIH